MCGDLLKGVVVEVAEKKAPEMKAENLVLIFMPKRVIAWLDLSRACESTKPSERRKNNMLNKA